MNLFSIKQRLSKLTQARIHSPALVTVTDEQGNDILVTVEEGYRLFPERRWFFKNMRGGPLTAQDERIIKRWLMEYLDYDFHNEMNKESEEKRNEGL